MKGYTKHTAILAIAPHVTPGRGSDRVLTELKLSLLQKNTLLLDQKNNTNNNNS